MLCCWSSEWAATVEWVGSEGTVEKVRKEDWNAEGRQNTEAKLSKEQAVVTKRKVAAGTGAAIPVAPVYRPPTTNAPQKIALGTATAVKADRVMVSSAAERPGKQVSASQPPRQNIVGLLTRKNRQNISYQLRLGMADRTIRINF